MTIQLIHGDALTELQKLESDSIDLLCTDPPYGYSFMNKDWDRVVVDVDIWKECLRVLKPGAFGFIMSSPRQDVLCKMILNLIDAGFETNFSSIYWTYASGFPKAADVSKLVDKRLNAKREILGYETQPSQNIRNNNFHIVDKKIEWEHLPITKPSTPQAQKLEGAYCGFQPKPAVELILVVMKPLSEKTYVDQALANGKGISWLDDCRIPYQDITQEPSYRPNYHTYNHNSKVFKGFSDDDKTMEPDGREKMDQKGRFPANLLVSDDVLNDGRITKSDSTIRKTPRISGIQRTTFGGFDKRVTFEGSFNDSGSYSRYFDLDKWFDTTFPFIITPKPSKSEKNQGLDKWMPDKVNDGRQKPIDNPFQRGETLRVNTHPTVKSLKLMSWLVTLGSRPSDIVLDPFTGSGTTCIAAKMLGRQFVGIEINKEYCDIANARLDSITANGDKPTTIMELAT